MEKVLEAIKTLEGRIPSAEDIQKIVNQLVDQKLAEVKRPHLGASSPLWGSKFSAYGLEPADIEFAWQIQRAMYEAMPGRAKGPSEALENAFRAVTKAMDTGESGYGSQLVGAQYVAELWEQARLQNKIFPLFRFIPMEHPTVYVPIDGALPEMLYVAESATYNASNYGTSKTASNRATLSAKKLVIHQMWSGELEEDSIIPFVPFLRAQIGKAVGYYVDSLLLNGDTTNAATGNINSDDADPDDTKHYLALDGIRHLPIVTTTSNRLDVAGPVTASDLLTLLGYMGVWGVPAVPTDVVFICSMNDYIRLLDLDEVVTVDKYGPRATVLTGELGSIYGHPIIVSEAMPLTEADGKCSATAANNTKGQIVAVNRNGWLGGTRREGKIEFERIPATDQSRLVFSTRLAFTNFDGEVAAAAINITV